MPTIKGVRYSNLRSRFERDFPVVDFDEVLLWIECNLSPEEAFGEAELEYWAEREGYERED